MGGRSQPARRFAAARTDRPGHADARRHERTGRVAVTNIDRRQKGHARHREALPHRLAESRSPLQPDEGQTRQIGSVDSLKAAAKGCYGGMTQTISPVWTTSCAMPG